MLTTPSDLVRPSDDPSLAVPTARLDEAQRGLDAALALHAELPPLAHGVADVDLDRLEDRRRLKHARADVAQAQHLVDVALGMAQTRYRQARAPGRRDRLRALQDAAIAAQAAADALRDYDTETAAALGLQPLPPPLPMLLAPLTEGLARLEREINPPPPPAPPVRPGFRRVLVKEKFVTDPGVWHVPSYAGLELGPEDLPEAEAKVAIEKGWAVEVSG